MPPRDDLILFLDLETTGTDVPKDEIIEVGMSLVSTEEGYPEVASFSSIVLPSDAALIRLMDKKVVREMHQANGLLDEIIEVRDRISGVTTPDGYEGSTFYRDYGRYTQKGVESEVQLWLNTSPVGIDTTHIPLGGSGVLHFDRRFIKHFMPRLDARLTHWAYDVGVLRRSFIKAGVKYASMDAKTHRALDDARVHAEEWRWYQEVIGGLERV